MESLEADRTEVLPKIEAILETFNTTPVGQGFVDVITRLEHVSDLLAALTELEIAVNRITLWCDCSTNNKEKFGCPHGLGGPPHESGYFAEVCEKDYFDVKNSGIDVADVSFERNDLVKKCNVLAQRYVFEDIKGRTDYSPCFVPGLWLLLPNTWRRETYRAKGAA